MGTDRQTGRLTDRQLCTLDNAQRYCGGSVVFSPEKDNGTVKDLKVLQRGSSASQRSWSAQSVVATAMSLVNGTICLSNG